MRSKTTADTLPGIERIARAYGLEPQAYLPVTKGYRNESHPIRLPDGNLVNLMICKGESGAVRMIRRANRVSDFLAEHGFPARRTLDIRLLRIRAGYVTKYAALYTYLPGHTIAWEAYSRKHIKLLGKTMSDMHAALQTFDASALSSVAAQYGALLERMQDYFLQPGVANALAAKLELQIPITSLVTSKTVLRLCEHLPGQQALHMDFVRGNILYGDLAGDPTISGILDFEKAACGYPLFDIARTLAFLLVDCKYKPAAKVRKYFLQSGYHKRGRGRLPKVAVRTKDGRINLLEGLLDIFLLYDLYKFLRHNPYESLLRNEHFVRTRDLLLERGCIRKADLLQ